MEGTTSKGRKKSRGVGQVIERGKDKHQIRIFLGRDSTGKRHYFNETFHGKKKDAEKRKRELLSKHERGEPLTLSNDTLNAFLDEWLKAHPNLKESALNHYTRALGYYVRPHIGKKLLAKIEADDVQTLYSTLAEAGLAKSTIYFIHTLWSRVRKAGRIVNWRSVRQLLPPVFWPSVFWPFMFWEERRSAEPVLGGLPH